MSFANTPELIFGRMNAKSTNGLCLSTNLGLPAERILWTAFCSVTECRKRILIAQLSSRMTKFYKKGLTELRETGKLLFRKREDTSIINRPRTKLLPDSSKQRHSSIEQHKFAFDMVFCKVLGFEAFILVGVCFTCFYASDVRFANHFTHRILLFEATWIIGHCSLKDCLFTE